MQIRFRISLAVCMRSGASQQASAHASLPYVFAPVATSSRSSGTMARCGNGRSKRFAGVTVRRSTFLRRGNAEMRCLMSIRSHQERCLRSRAILASAAASEMLRAHAITDRAVDTWMPQARSLVGFAQGGSSCTVDGTGEAGLATAGQPRALCSCADVLARRPVGIRFR